MTKLEQKLIELGYDEYREIIFNWVVYEKKFFFHKWLVILDLKKTKIINADFGTSVLNLIAYLRYKKDLKELELCQD